MLNKCAMTVFGTGLALVCLAASAVPSAWARPDLTVVSFGGAYMRSQMLAYVRPYESERGVSIDMEWYNGGIDEVRKQVDAANVKWDVVDFEYSDLIRACEDGLLEQIDHSILPPGSDGTPAAEDFIEGALADCAVGSTVWSNVIAYQRGAFTGGKAPNSISSFFDVDTFPGKRGLRKDPRGTLEWALLADGVDPGEVYSILSTPAGVDRAFEILDTIKPHIVWWEFGSEPARLMAEGKVAMTSAWNGRLFRPIVEDLQPIEIIWDGQLWEIEFWGIPKGTPNLQAALDFVVFATETRQLANQTKYIPYGPARKSAKALVNPSIESYLPTYAANITKAVRLDSVWWAANLDTIGPRFEAWAKPTLGEVQQRGARF